MLRKNWISVIAIAFLFLGLLYQAASSVFLPSTASEVAGLQNTLNGRWYQRGPVDVDSRQDTDLVPESLVGPEAYEALGLMTSESTVNLDPNDKSAGKSYEGRKLIMVATGYDDSWESNYPYHGQPSYIGIPLQRGVVAVDPNVIPMGTRLYVEGYGEAIAADQGGAIKGNRIDLFFDSRQEALNWGIRTVKVTILS